MAGLGKVLAEGMQDFARGVYKGLDNGSTTRLTNRVARTSGKTAKEVSSAVTKSVDSQFGRLGAAAINTKPLAGIADSARVYMNTPKSGRSAMQAIKQGHMITKTINGEQVAQLSMGKVAGTAATVGVAGRVATGGGLYRDRYGNINVPGLPFI